MAIVCSSCDSVPSPDAVTGSPCAHCGQRLISVESDDLIGTTLDGRFQVTAMLGRGGMGIVYRAQQLSIGREVAIKVLDRVTDIESARRFFREAKVASALTHPNIVPIIDFGQSAEGRLYLAMELVRGKNLLEEIEASGPLLLPRVISIGRQLCDALEVAHQQSIVHRDLKLENVMLVEGKTDHVKILDFGLARSAADPSMQVTMTGAIAGTPRYMPPEVAFEAAAPAPAQDMYAVGVMLAELILGRALWVAPTLEALFAKKLEVEETIANIPGLFKPLITALLSTAAQARPSAERTAVILRELATAVRLDLEPAESKPPRAASPIMLAPTAAALTPMPASAPATEDPFKSIKVIELTDVTPQPAPAPTSVPAATAASSQAAHPFGPPKETDVPLRVEGERVRAAARTRARRSEPVEVAGSGSPLRVAVAALVVLAFLGTAAMVLYKYRQDLGIDLFDDKVQPDAFLEVTLFITSDGEHDVLVDDFPRGKTPLTLRMAMRQTAIEIRGPGLVTRQVVPDKDQIVRLESVRTEPPVDAGVKKIKRPPTR